MDPPENPDMFPNNKGLTEAPSLEPRGQTSKVPESGAGDGANNTAYSEHNENILYSQCSSLTPQKNLKRRNVEADEKKADKKYERRTLFARARCPLVDEAMVSERRARCLPQVDRRHYFTDASQHVQASTSTRPPHNKTILLKGSSDDDTIASNLQSTSHSRQLVGKGKRVASCACALPVVEKISWTRENPGRKFIACPFFNHETGQRGCNTFEWLDEDPNEWQRNSDNILIAQNHWLAEENRILKSRLICDGHEIFKHFEELWWLLRGWFLRIERSIRSNPVGAIVFAIVTYIVLCSWICEKID